MALNVKDDKDVETLLAQGEARALDYKAALAWEGDHKVELTKDIAAMANTRDGGILLIGVEEDTVNGQGIPGGLDPSQLASFDHTKIANFVHARFAPPIVFRIAKPRIDGKALVAIVVSEFAEDPVVCCKAGVRDGKVVFQPGQLLVRTAAASSEVADAQAMREVIGRAVGKKGDHLLEQMRRIVTGASPEGTREWTELLSAELSAWSVEHEAFLQQTGGHGTWSVVIIPTGAHRLDPLSHEQLRGAVERATVALRGWHFPHHRPDTIQNRVDGISTETNSERYVERWRLFRRPVFGHVKAMKEDRGVYKGLEPGQGLELFNAIYTITEYVLFAKRLAEAFAYEGDIVVRGRLTKCKGRSLVSGVPGRELFRTYSCVEDDVRLERNVHTTDLAAGWTEIAADMCTDLFALFNWSRGSHSQGPSRQMILEDIARLRDRGL